ICGIQGGREIRIGKIGYIKALRAFQQLTKPKGFPRNFLEIPGIKSLELSRTIPWDGYKLTT
ncbi:MAG: hypothetical protein JW827_06205, partial [Spirochaetes bacterium]|nr:hypothetical protein [Spirochaetota bacterium]